MKTLQKSLGIIIAFLAIGNLAWAQTWTEVNTKEALNAAIADGAHIRLTDDITLSGHLRIGQSAPQIVTIDLNGHTLERNLSSASSDGHVIEVYSAGTLTVTDGATGGTITGGWANNGGGICNYGTLYFQGGTISECKTAYASGCMGGGIKNNRGGTVTMSGGTIANCESGDCGGIYNGEGATLNVTGGTISNCKSGAGGGGIVNYGTATLSGLTLKDNTAGTRGGNLWNNGSLTIDNCVIKDGQATIEAGGLYLNGGQTSMTHTTVESNESPDGGGFFVTSGATLTLGAGSEVTSNVSKVHGGGGIVNYGTVTLTDGVSITGNTCHTDGDGIWSNGSLNVSGLINISGNGTNPSIGSNVFLKNGKMITLSGALSEGSNISVSLEGANVERIFTQNYTTHHPNTAPSTFFHSDAPLSYNVILQNDEAYLKWNDRIPYVHRWWDENSQSVKEEIRYMESGDYEYITGGTMDNPATWTPGVWTYCYVVKSDAVVECNGYMEDVTLILCDGAKLTIKGSLLLKPEDYHSGSKLNIYGQSAGTGQLIVDGKDNSSKPGIGQETTGVTGHLYIHGGHIQTEGGSDGAGIGGGNDATGPDIYIYGGHIEARGGGYAAGIGGGDDANGGYINIYGGEVYAYGGTDAAGIGGGEDRNGGEINIYGGRVEAHGGAYGAGIGGGQGGSGGTITIKNGEVYAYGGTDAAGIGGGEDGNGGEVTIYGGYVYADGTGWGAGIGGGEDGNGATVVINGGIVMAFAGSDAGDKNGCAIGSEDGDGHRGSLTIGSNLMVHAGQDAGDAANHLFTAPERVPACFFRPYARIEPCDHQGATYTIDGTGLDGTHTLQCTRCLSGGTPETHTFENGECTVCHVHGSISTVSVYMPVGSGNTWSYGTEPRYTVDLVTGSSFELPAASQEHLPAGVRFVGWRLGSPSQLGLTDLHVTENELNDILYAGETYTVNGNVSLTPRYKTFHVFTTAGNWNDAANWCWNEVPTRDKEIVIAASATIPAGCTAEADNLTIDLGGTITIADGGQLIHSAEGITATVQKHIVGYGTSDGGYRLITNPVTAIQNPESFGMTNGSYDLYRFDQSQELEWQNYKQIYFKLENGRGYLYANSVNTDLEVSGVLNRANDDISVFVFYNGNASFAGLNLVGNPFVCNAYLADGRDFYVLNEAGDEIVPATATAIAPMQGVFVQATADEENVTFTTTEPQTSGRALSISLTRNHNGRDASTGSTTTVIDNARIRFGEGHALEKFQLDPNHSKVYIPQNGKDCAVVSVGRDGVHTVSTEVPVNFKASENGTYTLSFSLENMDLDYLHLIDNLTGTDVDLLAPVIARNEAIQEGRGDSNNPQTASYTFEARTTDYASRFKLVFAGRDANDNNETFAFISNGELIVNGKGMLQVIDMTGRVILSKDATNLSTTGLAPGVYTVRLINGNVIKTRKIVF